MLPSGAGQLIRPGKLIAGPTWDDHPTTYLLREITSVNFSGGENALHIGGGDAAGKH